MVSVKDPRLVKVHDGVNKIKFAKFNRNKLTLLKPDLLGLLRPERLCPETDYLCTESAGFETRLLLAEEQNCCRPQGGCDGNTCWPGVYPLCA